MNDKVCTLSHIGGGKYSLLIQDGKGRVVLSRRGVSFTEAASIIEEAMCQEEPE